MQVSDFDFELPAELIAQEPSAERDGARLLRVQRGGPQFEHSTIAELPRLLAPGDLVVVNNTRVFPARLLGHREPSGGAVECLLIQRLTSTADEAPAEQWEALMHPGQKLKPGSRVVFPGEVRLHAEIIARHFHGRRTLRLWADDGSAIGDVVDRIGHVPLPPYIKRSDRGADRERYQTVFARERGSVAAPTAGLHFTPTLLQRLRASGIGTAEITLHVGYGTFQPVRVDLVEEHRVEPERYVVSDRAARAIDDAVRSGRRVVAVGTTTTRTLEAVAAAHDGRVRPAEGWTDLFIHPGFQFRVVSGLLTNFHLPRSSLLMLVSAFAGRESVLAAYAEAIRQRYRFYTYGDAMLVL